MASRSEREIRKEEDIIALLGGLTLKSSDIASGLRVLPPEMVVDLARKIAEAAALALEEAIRRGEEPESIISREVNGRAIAALQSASGRLNKAVIGLAPEVELKPRDQVVPAEIAYKIFSEMKRKALKEHQERQERIEKITKILLKLLRKIKNRPEGREEALSIQLKALAKEFEKDSGIRISEVAEKLSQNTMVTWGLNADSATILQLFQNENRGQREGEQEERERREIEEIIIELEEILQVEKGPSKAFKSLLEEETINKTVQFDRAWHEACEAEGQSTLESIAAESNSIVTLLFEGAYQLPEQVRNTNNVAELTRMLRIIPTSAEEFELKKAANVKLEIIHALHLIRTQSDMEYEEAVTHQLQRRIAAMTHQYDNETLILNPPTIEGRVIENKEGLKRNNHHVRIAAVDVGATKGLRARLIKIILKDLKSSAGIYDNERVKIKLHQADSPKLPLEETEELTGFDLLLIKVLGILFSEFRAEIYIEKLKYTIFAGGTNERSTGLHLGIHVTLNYMTQTTRNQYDSTGLPRAQAVPVEFQILAYMDADEERRDHDEYDRNRTAKLNEKLGINLSFEDFVLDLMTTVESGCDFGYRTQGDPEKISRNIDPEFKQYHEGNMGIGDLDNLPEFVDIKALLESGKIPTTENNEGLILLLLKILTKTEDGELKNKETLERILKYNRRHLRKVINICKEFGQRRGVNAKTAQLIEYKAQQLEKMISKPNLNAPRVRALLARKKENMQIKVTTEFGSSDQSIRSARAYNRASGFREEYDMGAKEKRIYEKYESGKGKKRPDRLSYIIKEQEDGSYQCFKVSTRNEKTKLLIWELIPQDEAQYLIDRKIHAYQIDEETGKGVLRVIDSDKSRRVRLRGEDILKRMSPDLGMSEHNKIAYGLIKDYQGNL